MAGRLRPLWVTVVRPRVEGAVTLLKSGAGATFWDIVHACSRPPAQAARGRVKWQNATMPAAPLPAIAIAASSARSLVACARQSGYEAIALDVFGDLDTRAAALEQVLVGDGGLRISPERLLAALGRLRAQGGVVGWVAGSGFEAQLDLLAAAASELPLIGNNPATVARVRSPGDFLALLARLGIAHPPSRLTTPDDPQGWLSKDAHACGGWHVRRLDAGDRGAVRPGGGAYFQRELAGTPMSALFLADGEAARVVGVARQIVRPLGRRPFVFRGGVGPVAVAAEVAAQLAHIVGRLTAALALRGLNGIDFIVDVDGTVQLLELNPRPTAAINLFHDAFDVGLLRAHVLACEGRLSPLRAGCAPAVRGYETVFARAAGQVSAALVRALLDSGWCADVPAAGTRHARAEPVCTVLAHGPSVADVEARLVERRCAVLNALAWAAGLEEREERQHDEQ